MNKTLGQIAYEAYCTVSGWKAPWSEVVSKEAWETAAVAVQSEAEAKLPPVSEMKAPVKKKKR